MRQTESDPLKTRIHKNQEETGGIDQRFGSGSVPTPQPCQIVSSFQMLHTEAGDAPKKSKKKKKKKKPSSRIREMARTI